MTLTCTWDPVTVSLQSEEQGKHHYFAALGFHVLLTGDLAPAPFWFGCVCTLLLNNWSFKLKSFPVMLRFIRFHTAERKCHVGTLGFTHFTLSVHLSCPAVANLSCHWRACHSAPFQGLHSKYYIRLIPTHAPSLVTQYITSHFFPTSLPDHIVLCSSSVPANVF